jgi:nucleotide-binding universal stress UspA family protein
MPQEPPDGTTQGVRKVLVATDFSDASARALDYAIALANPGAAVTLVYVHLLPVPTWAEPDAPGPTWMPAEPHIREETMERLRAFGAPAQAAGLPVKTILLEGLPADVILAQATALRPDLIAMGTHGRRGFDRWLMGSTAERVVRLSKVPVLVASAQPHVQPVRIRGVLCPLGFAAGSETLAFASALASHCRSALTVVHVLDGSAGPWLERRARERLLASAGAGPASLQTEVLVRTGHPSREILRAAQERGADIIVMGVHDRLPSGRCVLGSTGDHVLREATCAVVTGSAIPRSLAEVPQDRTAGVGIDV